MNTKLLFLSFIGRYFSDQGNNEVAEYVSKTLAGVRAGMRMDRQMGVIADFIEGGGDINWDLEIQVTQDLVSEFLATQEA